MVALLLGACSNQTAGGLVHVPFSISGLPRPDGGPLFLTTPLGWAVELDTAKIDLGPFYFNIDPPDPGQFRSGVVIAESLQQVTVDALNPALVPIVGGVSGQTGAGAAVAAEIDLFPPGSTITDPDLVGVDGGTAYLAGVATMQGFTVPFQGWVFITQNLASIDNPLPWIQRVNGALCDLNFTSSSQALTLQVDPTTWFDQANFLELVPNEGLASDAGAPDGGYGWTDVSAFNQAVLGQIQFTTGVYTFNLTSQ